MEKPKIALIRYLDRVHPIKMDDMGLPSIVTVFGGEYKLTCSIDRHKFRGIIKQSLVKDHFFSEKDAEYASEVYCESKYDDYKKAVLQL